MSALEVEASSRWIQKAALKMSQVRVGHLKDLEVHERFL
jgi:hypothetical protein